MKLFSLFLILCASLCSGHSAKADYDWTPDWFKDLADGEQIVLLKPMDSTWVRADCDFTQTSIPASADITRNGAMQSTPYAQASVTRFNKIMRWTNGFGLHAVWRDPDTQKTQSICLYLRPTDKPFPIQLATDALDDASQSCTNTNAGTNTLPVQGALKATDRALTQ